MRGAVKEVGQCVDPSVCALSDRLTSIVYLLVYPFYLLVNPQKSEMWNIDYRKIIYILAMWPGGLKWVDKNLVLHQFKMAAQVLALGGILLVKPLPLTVTFKSARKRLRLYRHRRQMRFVIEIVNTSDLRNIL